MLLLFSKSPKFFIVIAIVVACQIGMLVYAKYLHGREHELSKLAKHLVESDPSLMRLLIGGSKLTEVQLATPTPGSQPLVQMEARPSDLWTQFDAKPGVASILPTPPPPTLSGVNRTWARGDKSQMDVWLALPPPNAEADQLLSVQSVDAEERAAREALGVGQLHLCARKIDDSQPAAHFIVQPGGSLRPLTPEAVTTREAFSSGVTGRREPPGFACEGTPCSKSVTMGARSMRTDLP